MKTYGYEEKRIRAWRVCPICGETFAALSRRRRYCYKAECQEKRYEIKINKTKQKRKGK